jgi:molecular chaperone DnaJ
MDFYILLGIERDATLIDIKRAFKRLARKYHPDINPGDRLAAAQFRQIAEAYETLSDPDRRRRYDTTGPSLPAIDPVPFGFDGFDFSVSVSGSAAPTFGDLFADVFRPRDRQSSDGAPERGVDLHQSISLSFEEAMRGGERSMAVTRQDRCRGCRGSGRQEAAERRCLQCQGAGSLRSARGHMVFSKPCPQCRGTGRQVDARCPACGGQQVEMRSEPIVVALPPGLGDGALLRVPGKGHAGRNGGEAGDLQITVSVASHPLFRRDGDDLHLVVPIAVHEAALGAKLDVPALEGQARLRVPPGTQTGQRFRLRERGVPSARDGRRGDLVVEVRVVLPRVLDERSKELLREFGRINHENVRQQLDVNDAGTGRE